MDGSSLWNESISMNYRVKIKGGISIFYDKELAEQCAKKNKTKVEWILKTLETN